MFDQEQTVPAQLQPGGLVGLDGQNSGWTFVSGETITAKMEGYWEKTPRVPWSSGFGIVRRHNRKEASRGMTEIPLPELGKPA
jgi:hypothetical protein